MTNRHDLAILSPFPPYPPHAGGTAHIFHASRQLSHFYNISLYTLASDPASVIWGPMPEWCAELRAFPRPARVRWGVDPPAVHQEHSPELIAFLAHVWKQTPPDIVQIEFTSMAQYARLAREFGALVVCTAHNVAFLAQLRRARQEQTPALRIRRLAGMLSLWQYELRALRYCDIIVALGEVDAAVLRRWLPRVPIVCVPSGVDLEEWTSYSSSPASDEVLFVGNYAHPPNVEGACWFVHNVWPQIQAARPSARLTLAGRAPPPAIQALVSNTIRVPGAVVDLRPLYKSASVVVAPIFWGSGVRIKLLEALASGRPVVTTALAAEGLGLAEGHSALFAEQPHEFAAAVLRLLNDSQLSAYIGAAGRAIVEQRYDWRHIGRLLAGMYEGARAGVSHKTR